MISKRVTAFILIILSILFTAFSAKHENLKDDFMFYNEQKYLGYGSTLEEVERLYGASFEESPIGNDYGEAKVLFRDNKAVYIIIESEVIDIPNNLWVTSKGIGIGSTEEDLQKAYELTESDKYMDFSYDISLKADGDKLVKCAVDDREYVLSFYLSGRNICGIALGDIQAILTFK